MKILKIRYNIARIIDADQEASYASRIYDWFMIGTIILSLIPLMFLDENNVTLNIISWVTVIIFILDFIARCFVSPVDKYKIGRPWWRRYPFSFMGVVDFLSILPIFGMICRKFALFKIFRLARIVSILKFVRYSDKDDLLYRALKKNIPILRIIFVFAILYIFISSLVIYNVEPSINPTTGEVIFSSFFDSIYWSVVTLTTVGYGDIYPVTVLGKMFSICSMIFGLGMIATVSSVITTGFIQEINHQNHNNMAKVIIKGVYQMNGPKPFTREISCPQAEVGFYSQLMGNKSKQAQWIKAHFPGAETERGFSMSINIK